MVRPGQGLEVEVSLVKESDGAYACKGVGRLVSGAAAPDVSETVVNGRFTMRRLTIAPAPA